MNPNIYEYSKMTKEQVAAEKAKTASIKIKSIKLIPKE